MASNILNVLENVEKGRQNCIKNAKLANLPATDNMDIFNIGNLFLEQNNTEFIDPTTTWVRPSDWWDTKSILENAQDIEQDGVIYHPAYIMLLCDYDSETVLEKDASNMKTAGDAYIFSDEPDTLYVGNQTHTWDVSKDKPCTLGYKTRYIIIYMIETTNIKVVSLHAFKVTELIFGNMRFKNTSQSGIYLNNNKYIQNIEGLDNFQYYYYYNSSMVGLVNLKHFKMNVTFIEQVSGFLDSASNLIEIQLPALTENKYPLSFKSVAMKKIAIPNLIKTGGTPFDNLYMVSAYLPNLETSTGTICQECRSLVNIYIPKLRTTMRLCYNCYLIKTISAPMLETVTDSICSNCYNLETISLPALKELRGSSSFQSCYSLTKFTFPNTFVSLGSATQFQGCINLKTINLIINWRWSLNVKDCPLYHDCIIDMFNKLKDLTGENSLTLTIGATNLAKVTDEEKLIATNKNWILA